MNLKKTLQGMYLSTEKIDFSQEPDPATLGSYSEFDINFSQTMLLLQPTFDLEKEVVVQEQLIVAECMHASLGEEMEYSWETMKPRVERRLRRMYGVSV